MVHSSVIASHHFILPDDPIPALAHSMSRISSRPSPSQPLSSKSLVSSSAAESASSLSSTSSSVSVTPSLPNLSWSAPGRSHLTRVREGIHSLSYARAHRVLINFFDRQDASSSEQVWFFFLMTHSHFSFVSFFITNLKTFHLSCPSSSFSSSSSLSLSALVHVPAGHRCHRLASHQRRAGAESAAAADQTHLASGSAHRSRREQRGDG